jgi:hypothetical protein
MRQLRAWLARFKGLFQKAARERDLTDEIDSHLQMHIVFPALDPNLKVGENENLSFRIASPAYGGVPLTC